MDKIDEMLHILGRIEGKVDLLKKGTLGPHPSCQGMIKGREKNVPASAR